MHVPKFDVIAKRSSPIFDWVAGKQYLRILTTCSPGDEGPLKSYKFALACV
jgi:hypothetical protein